MRIGDAVDAGAVLEIDVVRRQRVIHASPGQSGIIAASHRSRVTTVAEVPDAEHRLAVREHRRGRMRVILVWLWRATRDDDLPLSVISEINVRQSLALLLPEHLFFGGR